MLVAVSIFAVFVVVTFAIGWRVDRRADRVSAARDALLACGLADVLDVVPFEDMVADRRTWSDQELLTIAAFVETVDAEDA